ncbi:MAG TPA: ATP-binding protein [Spongiibacteraceae bacterium]|nr:ATP-binding protein [Spongiibacteraceae bacterium]
MRRLFFKLFLMFCLAFMVIDLSHSFAIQFIKKFDSAALINVAGADMSADFVANTVATYVAVLLVALCLSAVLAWYLHQPIRIMRRAFSAMSEGRLDTRVRHLLGSRRDGIADLGRDFDGMAHRLEDLVAVRQRMLQDVSHELRSPLTRLQIAIGLAQQNPHNIHETLDRIESESLRLQSMLENMLTLAHMEMGAQLLPKEEIDIAQLLADIARDACFEARARGGDLLFVGAGPHIMAVHAELLHRAFENVIRNAVKYTGAGTCVEVLIECIGAQLLVVVTDRGPGVAADALAKIFEPFFRVPEQERSMQGFGLGLAIARSAIEFHGGTIVAANRLDNGLIVSISLPL